MLSGKPGEEGNQATSVTPTRELTPSATSPIGVNCIVRSPTSYPWRDQSFATPADRPKAFSPRIVAKASGESPVEIPFRYIAGTNAPTLGEFFDCNSAREDVSVGKHAERELRPADPQES
jgi:hypothetical protein